MKCMYVLMAAGLVAGLAASLLKAQEIPADQAKRIKEAAPQKARVAPKQPRRVLIFNTPAHIMDKDPHKGYCIPYGEAALKALGEKSGAFTPVVSDDISMFLPDNLKQFDAVVLNNTSGRWIVPSPAAMAKLKDYGDAEAVEKLLRKSLMDWIASGKGIVGIHFAIAGNDQWPEFKQMFCGTFVGHPWNEEIGVKIEDSTSPLTAAFGGKDFRVADEIYTYGKPYDRSQIRVLMSVDPLHTNMSVPWIPRQDADFALTWVRPVGKGRLFYTSFGHRSEIYSNPAMLQFYLDAIQFATGDLEAPMEPRPATAFQTAARKWEITMPTQEQMERMRAATPDQVPVKTPKPRKVLVFGRLTTHQPNPYAAELLKIIAQKTKAFEVTISDNPDMLLPPTIQQFDAIVINNLHEESPFLPPQMDKLPAEEQQQMKQREQAARKGLLEYISGGKGVVGIHAATAACANWPEYGEMIGGYYGNHIAQEVTIRNEDPQNPINAALKGQGMKITDEIYIFREPYSRQKLHVLLSLDVDKMADPGKRPDKDYAVSWTKPYGQGRVFYTTLGHASETYWNPTFVQHLIAAIQYATGDLKVPTTNP